MRTIQMTYQFRMEPTPAQEQQLLQFAGARRFIWNWALHRKRTYYQEHGHGLPFTALCAELTALKDQPASAWLRAMDSQSLQQALRDLEQAFTNFFEHRARYPRFKSKKRDTPRFRIPQRVSIQDGTVRIPKIGTVRIRQHRSLEGVTKSATFKRNATGHWFVTVIAQVKRPDWSPPSHTSDTTVGVDAGLTDFAVLSTGERIANPRFARHHSRVLKRAHRHLSRTEKGSRNHGKARIRLARVYRRIRNQRADFLHQQSRRIINRCHTVAIEDLNVRALAKSKLSRSFADAAHGQFRFLLRYKADWDQKTLVVIDRFFPSSQLCHQCCARYRELTLDQRQWGCICGVVHDRDVNAAINIQQEALRLLAGGSPDSQNACGALVRPTTVGAV